MPSHRCEEITDKPQTPVATQCTALTLTKRFPGGSAAEPTCNAGKKGSIPSQEDPLEEEKAAHSSILARRIPWTEEPGGLQSTGSQRVRRD